MKRGSVIICYADGGQHDGFFGHTLAAAERGAGGRVIGRIRELAGPMIADSRNTLVDRFLETEAEWMWMVDTDMVFTVDTLARLLETAHWKDRPIVGGLCFGSNRVSSTLFPTIYWFTEEGAKRGDNLDLRSGQVIECDATGAACLLIHRHVLEKLEAEYPRGPYEFTWLQNQDGTEQRVGEDVTFCARAGALGFPTHVDLNVLVGHVKPVILDLDFYERHRGQL